MVNSTRLASVASVAWVASVPWLVAACGDDYSETDDDADCFQGSLEIVDESDVATLNPYTCMTGSLVMYSATLTSLELPNLETIGGHLLLTPSYGYDFYLMNLDFSSLVSVGGDVEIRDEELESLDGLGNLTSVSGELEIGWNSALSSLAGLSNLTSVGDNLRISYNPILTTLGMGALTEVGGSISIIQNYDLPQCEACDLVEQVGGDPVGISGNQSDSCADSICY